MSVARYTRQYRAFSCDVTNFAGNLDRHVGVPWDNSISIMAASPLSDYANNLDPHTKKRYCEKISCVGIDPILIPEKTYDPDCLPRVESMDLLSFLVLETSYYSKDQFKAFRSLQAYNQLVSGFVSCVKGHKIGNNYIVLGRHSQRMNDPRVTLWIITKENGAVLFAHCIGCMAGQGDIVSYQKSWEDGMPKKEICPNHHLASVLSAFAE